LIQQDAIPKQQLDTQLATVEQLKGAIKTDQATIDDAKLQLTYCHITAPISGRIGLRMVDAGNMVHAADPNGLVVITQVQPISIFFTIPEDSLDPVLKKLRDGDRLPVDAYDRSGASKIASGFLFTVDNQIDQTTGTIRLKAVFDNRDNALFPNQFVNVKLLTDTKKNSILVPVVAIQYGPQESFAYVVKNDKTVEVRPVTVGTINENIAQIQKGLSAGETVVTDGVDKLREGSKVVVQGKDQHKGSGHRGNQ
jgi:membrane fusion protein, multidrug efflux system